MIWMLSELIILVDVFDYELFLLGVYAISLSRQFHLTWESFQPDIADVSTPSPLYFLRHFDTYYF